MKTLAEIVTNVQRMPPLTRTMSCPNSLSQFSDASNAIVSINNAPRPQTGKPKHTKHSSLILKERQSNERMPTSTVTASILPAKRPCDEQKIDAIARPPKTKRREERAADTAAAGNGAETKAKFDVPPPAPGAAKEQDSSGVSNLSARTTSLALSNKASKKSRKRLSRSSTIDNSELRREHRPMKVMKQQSVAIETWRRNSIKSRQRRNIEQQNQTGITANNNDLLSNFMEYSDQLQSPASQESRQPKRSTINGNLMSHDDGVPLCLMESDTTTTTKEGRSTQRTTEATVDTLASKSQPQHVTRNDTGNFSKLSIVLRTFFVLCSSLSCVSRCLIWLGGRKNILHSLVENPCLWTLRFYISIFHAALLLVELGLGIPVILPRGETLKILTQRGFVQTYLGITDLFMHSNESMAEHISILEGTVMSARERRVQISYAIISVSSRGMIVIGAIYFLFGLLYDDYGGKKRKQQQQNGGMKG